MLLQIYEFMAAAATIDLHWEVKKIALEFWDEVISECLKNQGMIDGSFPEVTFSKDCRKIVTLTENEVQRRLNKVLIELNANGCLTVLMSAIQDDCDVDVVEKAVVLTKKFVTLLNKYKVVSCQCGEKKVEVDKFLEFTRQNLDKFVENKRRWLKNMNSFGSLLDDMLRDYEGNDDINNMDCY